MPCSPSIRLGLTNPRTLLPFPFWQSEIFSSAYASAVYLKHVLKLPEDRKVYVLGMEGIQEELEDVGLKWCGGTVSEQGKPVARDTLCSVSAPLPSIR